MSYGQLLYLLRRGTLNAIFIRNWKFSRRRSMHPARNKRHVRTKRTLGFSLIELLVVIVIISILLVVAAPVFSGSSDNARRGSKEIIKAHLQQARAHAIANGTATAVVIPILDTGSELGARSISLFEVELKDGDYIPVTDASGNGLMVQRAETLPGNFHFVSSSSISSDNPTIVDLSETMSTSFKGQVHDNHYIVFAPNGQIVRPLAGTPINIAIAQAKKTGSTLTLTERNAGQPVFEIFQINRLTGRTRQIKP